MFLELKCPLFVGLSTEPGNITTLNMDREESIQLRICTQRILPVNLQAWIQESFVNTAKSGKLRFRTIERGRTGKGWPLLFAKAQIFDAQDRVIGERMGAFYRLLSFGAEAVIVASDPERFFARKEELESMLLSASARWPDGEAATLSSLLSMDLDRTSM